MKHKYMRIYVKGYIFFSIQTDIFKRPTGKKEIELMVTSSVNMIVSGVRNIFKVVSSQQFCRGMDF